jgi:rubrerythrin
MKKCAFSLALLLVFALTLSATAFATKTLDNLQTAFNGESNANARYLAFAKQADKEGYKQAASLFRAAARAEEIHAQNHAVVIKKLGGTPQAKIDTPEVKTTADNLIVAIKGEVYERDVMYPDFIKQARAERERAAIETFNYALTAEADHAKLYTNAKENLGGMKTAGVKYYVCTICGYTTAKIDFEKCPACFNPKEKYVAVS